MKLWISVDGEKKGKYDRRQNNKNEKTKRSSKKLRKIRNNFEKIETKTTFPNVLGCTNQVEERSL